MKRRDLRRAADAPPEAVFWILKIAYCLGGPWAHVSSRLPKRQHLLIRRFGMRVNESAGPVGQLLPFALSDSAHFPSNEL